jgi:hypothetical protein
MIRLSFGRKKKGEKKVEDKAQSDVIEIPADLVDKKAEKNN